MASFTALDRTDRRILMILQKEGRITNTQLAERIGLSATACSERTKFLLQEGYITGFAARLDPHRLGFDLLVFVEILLDKTTPDVFERFALAVKAAPEVLECHMVAGGFDYLIKTRLANMKSYRRFLGDVIQSLPGVKETRSYAVMDEIKKEEGLHLP